jgi:hypothetical protein
MRIKKISLVFYVLSLVCTFYEVKAQYQKGDLLINPNISFIGYGYGYRGAYDNYSIGLPAIAASVEYNITEDIAVGPYLGFQTRSYRTGTFKDRLTNIGVGGRCVYHASKLLELNDEQIDVYGGASIGINIFNWSSKDRANDYFDNRVGSGLSAGVFVGGRYMFQPNLGVFAEFGRGSFGVLAVGVTLKL